MRTTARARLATVILATVLSTVLTAALSGCGITIPTDPNGTLDDIRGGTVHAGVSLSEGLAHESPAGTPRGPVIELVDEFAEEQGARVEWTIDSEERLVDELESGDLDIAVGGMTDQTPWTDRAGVTRGYAEIEGSAGRSIVMLVPLGENELLSTLEEFLDRTLEKRETP
jgi:ABC-type amino acid transport substrate-binding protein